MRFWHGVLAGGVLTAGALWWWRRRNQPWTARVWRMAQRGGRRARNHLRRTHSRWRQALQSLRA
ncbi:MAG: hypothetical protein KM310_08555 [Clostridiales bacterium]|nr:hypothetical protein [Clostridiales bacterium]